MAKKLARPVFSTEPIGLVDFIGYSDELPELPPELTPVQRSEVDAWNRKTIQHPSFQPLIRVENEVEELELAGALLGYIETRGLSQRDKIGIARITGGWHYIDKVTGEYHVDPRGPPPGRATTTFGRPEFFTRLKLDTYRDCYVLSLIHI